MSRIRRDLGYFERVPFRADPLEPVDRWFQLPDSRSVEEIRRLIDLSRARGHAASVLVDPYAGAGGAAVAARDRGMEFVGWEAYAPRALYALSKSIAMSASPEVDAESLASVVHSLRGDRQHLPKVIDVETGSEIILAAACAVSEEDPDIALRAETIVEAIVHDLELNGQLARVPALIEYGDIRDTRRSTCEHRAALVITSPPHPQTRANFLPVTNRGVRLAHDVLVRVRGTGLCAAVPLVPRNASTPLFRFVRSVFPRTCYLIVEFETPPDCQPTDTLLIDAAAEWGFVHEETVVTYETAPDGKHGGYGGMVIFTNDPEVVCVPVPGRDG